jgi:WD40 repeat protein
MGVVYEAIEESLGRHVALKALPAHARASERFRERFQREARAAARLHHPHIVPVFGVGDDSGVSYYAMQFIRGRGLDAVLAPEPGPGGAAETTTRASSLTPADGTPAAAVAGAGAPPGAGPAFIRWVADIGAEVADALAYAHGEGVIHRDIKPSNLLLDEGGSVWVTDFGLAKTTDMDGLTAPGDIVGTVRYMAPERFDGWSDARSDVYGLGATLFELLTGRPLFDEPDHDRLMRAILNSDPPRPRKLNRAIPRDLETIVLKATAREPGHRYASARALADDLRRFGDDRPILARRHSWVAYAWRACKRKPFTAATSALLAIALLALLVGSIVVNIRLDDRAAKIRDARAALEAQLQETNAARGREAEARVQVRQQLMSTLRREASAPGWTRRPGGRGQAFDAVRALTDPAADSPPSAEEVRDLRDVVIAASARIDVAPERPDGPSLPPDCVFAPDLAHYAVTTGEPGLAISVHEYPSRRQVARLRALAAGGYKFSPDGRYLLFRDGRRGIQIDPHTLVVWDWAAGRVCAEIPGRYERRPWAVSPDSTELIVAQPGRPADVYSLLDGAKRRTLRLGTVACLEYDPGGGRLATVAPGEGRVQIRDLADGKVVLTLATPTLSSIMDIAWSADGSLLAAGCANFRVCVWHTENGQVACELLGHTAEPTTCIFDPNGQWLATSGWDGQTRFWDPVTGQALLDPLLGMVTAVSADGKRIGYFTKHDSGVWSVTEPRELVTLHPHTGGKGPWHAAFSPDGRALATSSGDAVRFWDAATGRPAGTLRPPGGAITAHFTPDRKYLLTAGGDHCSRWPTRYDAGTNALHIGPAEPLLVRYAGPANRRAALSADGSRAAIFNDPFGRVHVFPVADPDLYRSFGPMPGICDGRLSPDGRWVVATSWPGPGALVWDTRAPRPPHEFTVEKPVTAAFSPDGKYLVLGSALKGEVWTVGTWKHVRDIPANSFGPAVLYPTYSPDGQVLAVCRSSSRAVHLLDAGTFEEFARLEAPDAEPINALGFSPDGGRLAVACATRVTQVWDLRALRDRLATLGLDWNQTPYPPTDLARQPLRLVTEHPVVARALVAHPGDHRSLGPLLDRNAFRPGHRAAPDRRGVVGNGTGQPVGDVGVRRVEAEERDHRPVEVVDVLGLGLLPASGIGFLLLGEAHRGPLGFEFDPNAVNGRRRRPHAP